METMHVEALVVGSGFGAAAAALRLAEAGIEVLVVEKGPDIVPERDYRQTQDPTYLLKYIKGDESDAVKFMYAEALGGGSAFYEMVSLRAPSKVFEQRDERGRRYWPKGIDRVALDRYYDIAEQILGVEQIAVDEIPKSGIAFATLMKNLGYSCDRARYAAKGCVGSGYCITGCLFGAKQSLHLNYLPMATAAGARVLTSTEVISVSYTTERIGKINGEDDLATIPYRYVAQCVGEKGALSIRAKIAVLGGGTIGTAKLLMRSRRYLANLSNHVGRNIAFNGCVKAVGILPEGFIQGDMAAGRSHHGLISYHFFEEQGITISSVKPLPIITVGTVHLSLDRDGKRGTYWGRSHVELMKHYRRRMMVLYALGLTPPVAGLRSKVGGGFEPYLDVDDMVRSYYTQTKELLESILTRNGCQVARVRDLDARGMEHDGIFFDTAHMIGSCRMAENRDHGVVDAAGEVFGYPGLYVCDGAVVPTSLAVNSSLTVLANAERIASGIAKRHGRTRATMPAARAASR